MNDEYSNLRGTDVDRLGKALLTLAKELWVVKDRQALLEAALADAGIVASELVDRYEPDTALQEQLAAERAAFIEQLLHSLEQRD